MKSPVILSLHSQLVSILRQEIASGAWDSWLPDERSLAKQYHVSRTTIRLALKTLESEKLLVTRVGMGRQVAKRPKTAAPPASRTVGFLSREPLSALRASYSQWAGELRSLLFEHHLQLEFHSGENYFTKRARQALPALISRYSHVCWVLLLSSETTQHWFAENQVPCVIAGSCHAGVDLPSLDGDQEAKCRHAVGVLIGNGHRRIVFLHANGGTAGDSDSERGFLDGVAKSSRKDIRAEIVVLTPDYEDICRKVRALLLRADRPTAFLVSNPHHFLATVTTIWRMGLRIPDDVSVISRDYEPFIKYMNPLPAHYVPKARSYAEKLGPLILRVINKEPNPDRHLTILPEFSKGESIANLR